MYNNILFSFLFCKRQISVEFDLQSKFFFWMSNMLLGKLRHYCHGIDCLNKTPIQIKTRLQHDTPKNDDNYNSLFAFPFA